MFAYLYFNYIRKIFSSSRVLSHMWNWSTLDQIVVSRSKVSTLRNSESAYLVVLFRQNVWFRLDAILLIKAYEGDAALEVSALITKPLFETICAIRQKVA